MSFNVLGYAATNGEVKLLEDLGIIKPISHTGLIKAGYNRGEFAASLSVMSSVEPIKYSVSNEDLKKYAEDIAGNENVNGIIVAIAGGYMENDEKNNFNPDSALSKDDAIKALVRILGYEPLAESYGGTTQAYYQAAGVIGLLKKCSFEDEKSLTQEETAKLLVNAMSIRFFNDGTRYLDKECFYDYWRIEKHTGRVLANSRIGLVVERTSPGMVNIDEKLYETELLDKE